MQGIIYKATNLINGKLYIGQTRRDLSIRISNHYIKSKSESYKFARALRKYSKDDWRWEIIDTCNIVDLDEKEEYYINLYDSFKEGYNSSPYAKHKKLSQKIINTDRHKKYSVYRPDVGIITATREELHKLFPKLGHRLTDLLTGRKMYTDKFVLAENKDKYNELLEIFNYYHPNYGVVSATVKYMADTYFEGKKGIHTLNCGKSYIYKGWILAKYKDYYEYLSKFYKIFLTLKDPESVIKTLPLSDFLDYYKFDPVRLRELRSGERKSYRGWTFIKEENFLEFFESQINS